MSYNSKVFLKPLINHIIILSNLHWQVKFEETNQYWDNKLAKLNEQNLESEEVRNKLLTEQSKISRRREKHHCYLKQNQETQNGKLIHDINELIKQKTVDQQKIVAFREYLELSFIKKMNELLGAEKKKIEENNEHDQVKKNLLDFHLDRLTFLIGVAFSPPPKKKKIHWLTQVRNGAGKFVKKILQPFANTADDVANAIQGVGDIVAKVVLGVAVTLVHILNFKEGIEGVLKAIKLPEKARKENKTITKVINMLKMHDEAEYSELDEKLKDEELNDIEIAKLDKHHINQYETRMVTNSLGIFTSLMGIGTASAYIAYAFGAAVLAGPFLPSVFFGLLAIKSGYDLWLKIAIVKQANQDAIKAKILRNNIFKIFKKQQERVNEASSLEEKNKLNKLSKAFEASDRHYQACVTARYNARKEVVFHALELVLNTVVFVSTVIGSIVSLGASSAIMSGIALGAASFGIFLKGVEWGDKRIPIIKKIIECGKNVWNKLFPAPAKKNVLGLKPELIKQNNFMHIKSLIMKAQGKSELSFSQVKEKVVLEKACDSNNTLLPTNIIEQSIHCVTFGKNTNVVMQGSAEEKNERLAFNI